jgi:lipoprotein-anchoring transpeptidase ErfK/SrfK
VRTNGAGRFELQQDIRRRTVFRLEASLPSEDVTAQACSDPIVPAGCVSATRGPVTVRSETLAVRVSRPPTLRLGDRGPEVVMLQKRLTELRYLPARSANGSFDWRTWHAVVAFQGWQLLPRDGEVSGGFWKSLERARPPRPWGGLKDGLQIDRERQVAFLVEQGEVRRAIHVSTGAGGATPAGQFAVYRKETLSWSVPFKAWLPWASYFTGGIALHEYPSVPAYAASHGCVRVPADEARIVYSFAGEGTTVWVR